MAGRGGKIGILRLIAVDPCRLPARKYGTAAGCFRARAHGIFAVPQENLCSRTALSMIQPGDCPYFLEVSSACRIHYAPVVHLGDAHPAENRCHLARAARRMHIEDQRDDQKVSLRIPLVYCTLALSAFPTLEPLRIANAPVTVYVSSFLGSGRTWPNVCTFMRSTIAFTRVCF